RHTTCYRDWSSDVCSSDLTATPPEAASGSADPAFPAAPGATATPPLGPPLAPAAEDANVALIGAVLGSGTGMDAPPRDEPAGPRSEERRVGKGGSGWRWRG